MQSLLLICLEPRKAKPILKTDEPICPDGKLSCGDGECLDKELFCNGKPDCKDESDENACSKWKESSLEELLQLTLYTLSLQLSMRIPTVLQSAIPHSVPCPIASALLMVLAFPAALNPSRCHR